VSGRPLPEAFRPAHPPSGTANFANLFRDPAWALQALVAQRLAEQGFDDLRPALTAVGAHMRAEGIRITELAERTLLTKATVVQTVDELERLGYAERVPDPSDGRAKLVRPTARGLAAEAAGREAIDEIRDAWARAVGKQRVAQLEAALLELRAALWPDEGERKVNGRGIAPARQTLASRTEPARRPRSRRRQR
jgi:DNA-binding MarR family transcriptional regulator